VYNVSAIWTVKTDRLTLFVYCNFLVLLSTTVCRQNINKQNVNIADETLTDYSFLSRYYYTKSKNYLKRRYHWIPMFIGTPCSIKQIIFNKYTTNLKTTISHRSLRISGFLPFKFLNFYFAFLIDIIDNIITYSSYNLYYIARNLSQWQCSIVVTWYRRKSRDQFFLSRSYDTVITR